MSRNLNWLTTYNTGSGDANKMADLLSYYNHVELQALQDDVTVRAIKDPKNFIDERSKAFKKLNSADSPTAKAYAEVFRYYQAELGLPPVEAEALAVEAIESMAKANAKAFDMVYAGGYQKAMGVVKTEQNARVATAGIADAEIVKDAEYYKRKSKANKQKYRALKGGK